MVFFRLHGESNVRVFIIYKLEKFQSILFVVEWAKGVMHISAVEINCRTIVLLEPHSFMVAREKISKYWCQWRAQVSFDVESLFTNIPLLESIELAVDYILTGNPNIRLSKGNLKELFLIATAQTHFLFQGNYYDQIDGVAMGYTCS